MPYECLLDLDLAGDDRLQRVHVRVGAEQVD
jgi:hypothetical protein